jgi:hypothetical protein
MDARIDQASRQLARIQVTLQGLYPGLVSTGSPFYIDKRRRIATKLVFAPGTTRCTAVARLILEASIGRRLLRSETCDHKDWNSLNDRRSNLQVLTLAENARKGPSPVVRAAVAASSSVARPDNAGALNGNARLSNKQVTEIKRASVPYVRGKDKVLAMQYGVSRELVSQIRRCLIRKS